MKAQVAAVKRPVYTDSIEDGIHWDTESHHVPIEALMERMQVTRFHYSALSKLTYPHDDGFVGDVLLPSDAYERLLKWQEKCAKGQLGRRWEEPIDKDGVLAIVRDAIVSVLYTDHPDVAELLVGDEWYAAVSFRLDDTLTPLVAKAKLLARLRLTDRPFVRREVMEWHSTHASMVECGLV